ncbi:hypothetical protein AVEN_194812-1 [Araneus ventricosus]|uniref:Uncharacterized protein n=1 Tax=Araneus ventricosus TaxID=182803 RepID=A0A4Y2B5G7_ARAVE|nr:hypothetical protein AVEN_194812-1 [Araneus ventricosus]
MVTDARGDLPQVNYVPDYGRLRTQVNFGEPEIANQNPAAFRVVSVEPNARIAGLAIPAGADAGYLADARTTPGVEFESGVSSGNPRTDLASVETSFRGIDIRIPRTRLETATNGMPTEVNFGFNAGIPRTGLGTANDFVYGRNGFDRVDARPTGIGIAVADVGLVGRGILPEYERVGIDSGPGEVADFGFGNSGNVLGYGAVDSDMFVIGTGMIDGLDYVRYGY